MIDVDREVGKLWWYHTIELSPGLRTPGWYDTIKAIGRIPFPSSLAGKRCLDVGTANGFWAFEMEKRGALEVVAIDVSDFKALDWPPRSIIDHVRDDRLFVAPFEVAHQALGSNVKRIEANVYEIDEVLDETFDFVFMGSLLLHLRDPVRALTAVRHVTRGDFMSMDAVSLRLSATSRRVPAATLAAIEESYWWTPNLAGLRHMIYAAGFRLTRVGGPVFLPFGKGGPSRRLSPRSLLSPRGLTDAATVRLGATCGWVTARPEL